MTMHFCNTNLEDKENYNTDDNNIKYIDNQSSYKNIPLKIIL